MALTISEFDPDESRDAGIEFGQLEEAELRTHLRPDRNKHFAVAAYEVPRADDLPIFIDLDVMRDIELHAREDTSVELGGVLLGGQYVDQEGRPFVVVTDSLRARHYEATKGSFKFTHDTWQQISRERDQFPDDLQMVGWYHTHPDWGVFLSGMDFFICEHFFKRPLDLALVVDPCRSDRGMFQWTENPSERIRRTGGFHLMTSRFRRQELDFFAATLEGKFTMATDPRFSGIAGHLGPMPAPVVNIAESRSARYDIAIMGMLTMQFLVLALIAWKLIVVPAAGESDKQARQVASIERKLDEVILADQRADAHRNVVRAIAAELDGGPSIVDQFERLERDARLARVQAEERLALNEKLNKEIGTLQNNLLSAEKQLELRKARSEKQLDQLATANRTIEARDLEIAKLRQEIAKLTGRDVRPTEHADWALWTWISVGAGLAVLLVAAGVAATVARRDQQRTDDAGQTSPEDDPPETNNDTGQRV